MNSGISRAVLIGGFGHIKALTIGGGHPVVIQTMWKDSLGSSDIEGTRGEEIAARIGRLQTMGCGLIRFAVPDRAAAEVLGRLSAMVSMPLVADIHFDHTIALRCMDFPIAKIRINPGNIGNRDNVRAVLEKAAAKGIPIRIGVNAGSLPQDLRDRPDRVQALVEAAERELAVCEECNFPHVVVSIKAATIADTVMGNRILARKTTEALGFPVPLHIGVTEAGPLVAGTVRSSAALSILLAEGIGDTIRVSLSDSMENEVIAAREICAAAADMASLASGAAAAATVAAARLRDGVRVVSCPRCGRHSFDTHGFTGRWLDRLYALDTKLTVAIMGCVVNGPGEAKYADVGITGAGDKVLIFRHGRIIRTITAQEADTAFAEELAIALGHG